MKLGLNLSFAVKRWMEPERLAEICGEELQTDHIQFSWDFIDPWWPEEARRCIAGKFRQAFEENNLSIDCTFGGNAAYAFPHLLAPDKDQREIALEYFKRAADLTLELGSSVMGSPAGTYSVSDSKDSGRKEVIYQEMIEALFRLADYGKSAGLTQIQIEATPLFSEEPHDIEGSLRLMKSLEGSAIPVRLLLDWGHALFKPLLGKEADMGLWMRACSPYIGAIHLQQTDGLWDEHWDFTHQEGMLTAEYIKKTTHESGLDDVYQYLEIVPRYEEFSENVLNGMKRTMEYLRS